ncbi:MAG: ATP-binding cassette domain-containing protein, partial [Chloroflexota bacterium]
MDERLPVLEVRNLKVQFASRDGVVRAVEDLSFDVLPDETLAIVGESGCGKSVTAQAVLNVLPRNGRIVAGQ